MKKIIGIISIITIGCGPSRLCGDNSDCEPGLFCDEGYCLAIPGGSDSGEPPPSDSGGPTPDSGSPDLPDGIVYISEPMGWFAARDYCWNVLGTHLVEVSTPELNATLGATLDGGSAWIGLHTYGACVWNWILTGPIGPYTNWGTAQPDQCGAEACGLLWGGEPWGDSLCDVELPFFCAG